MNKTYEKLRKKVYEIIYPDGIPLEFGCEVKYKTDNWSVYKSRLVERETMAIHFFIEEWSIPKEWLIEKLWPDLSLQDILKALEVSEKNISYTLQYDKVLWWCYVIIYPSEIRFRIDLSKKVKDRKEEKHLQLLELLNGK